MPEGGYKIRAQEGLHFITFAVLIWVDEFIRKQYREVLIEGLDYCKKSVVSNAPAMVSDYGPIGGFE